MADIVLNDVEARLLGVLVEKQITTPDQYPLSVKALIAGANQKSNRDPVVSYGEAEVVVGVQGLEAKALATRLPAGMGARVERYEHTATHALSLDRQQLAVIAELLLRGPQQPGELRTRAGRMASFDTLLDLNRVLEKLIERRLVKRLAPSPGTRAERYRELLSSPAADRAAAPSPTPAAPSTPEEVLILHDALAGERQRVQPESAPPSLDLATRVTALEARLEALERLIAARGLGGSDAQA
ncbi:MAG: DUF480 domain-containing protein [Planctomycetota bacterium]